jgi:LAO/AO transport system kinase
MERADAVLINKADGDNKPRAESTRQQYEMALHYLQPATGGWRTCARTCSAMTGHGIPEVWTLIEEFRRATAESGAFDDRRRRQTLDWMNQLLEEALRVRLLGDPRIAAERLRLEDDVLAGRIGAPSAVEALLGTAPAEPRPD